MSEFHPLLNHLWQSTFIAGAAASLSFGLRKNQASLRHSIWFVASVKFLIPFSLLIGLGNQLGWQFTLPPKLPHLQIVMVELGPPISPALMPPGLAPRPPVQSIMPLIVAAVWFCGFAGVLLLWGKRWIQLRSIAREAVPLQGVREVSLARGILRMPVDLRSTASLLEPGVFGIVRPVLLLPSGISERLSDAQLEAILTHELCHLRRRDNLTAAIHMFVEAIFWFHPGVWWIGSKLIEERERSCDEEVLRLGSAPQIYAESILKVCEFYLESPLACVSGVTGSNLNHRIEAIMTGGCARKLNFTRKLLIAMAALASLAVPIGIGLANTRAQASPQSGSDAWAFDVASIKLDQSWKLADEASAREMIDVLPGRLTMRRVRLSTCLKFAFGVKDYQISGPSWLNSERYDIRAKTSSPVPADRMKLMLQALLRDRFKLVIHREVKELPVYNLVSGKTWAKLPAANSDDLTTMKVEDGSFVFRNTSLPGLAEYLSSLAAVARPVIDKTGINGAYDFKIKFADNNEDMKRLMMQGDGPSIFTLIQEQLGLKLEAQKGLVEILFIEHVEKIPTEN